MKSVFTIYRKELRETLRDRRTLIVMVLLPLVIYPVMAAIASQMVISHQARRQASRSRVALAGAIDRAAPIQHALEDKDLHVNLLFAPGELPADRRAALLADADAVIDVPADFTVGGSARIHLYFDGARDSSLLARERVEKALDKLASAEVGRRLAEKGLERRFLEPVPTETVDLASRARLGRAEAGKSLPFVVILMVLVGSFYPAIDLTAGEKERGTLEALLATPVPRRAVVAGKYLAVATIAFLTGLLNVLFVGITILWVARSAVTASGGHLGVGDLAAAIPASAVALGILALACTAALFSGIMIGVASLARTFKEAQNYLAPIHFVATVPAMSAFLPGTRLDYGTALIPVANVTLLLKDVISGTLAAGPALLALASTSLFALAGMALAARIYESERLLFAPEGTRGGMRQALRALFSRRKRDGAALAPGGAALGPGESMALFAAVVVLFLFFAFELQSAGLWGFAVSQWLLIAAPVLLYARTKRRPIAETLALRPPPARAIVGALLIGASVWYVNLGVGALQERIAPAPRELTEKFSQIFTPFESRPLLVLISFALTPAICEELLCRAVLARGLRSALGASGAVVVSALLFAMFHQSAYRFVPQFLLGLSLGAVTLASRSVLPAMIIHALHNAGLLFASDVVLRLDSRILAPFAVLTLIMGHAVLLSARQASTE